MDSPYLSEKISDLHAAGILIDPLLAHNFARTGHVDIMSMLSKMTQSLHEQLVQYEQIGSSLEDVPLSPNLLEFCLQDTLLTTAIAMTFRESGALVPIAETLEVAKTKIIGYVREYGIASFYTIYLVICEHDMMQPLYYHKEITEAEFLQGIRHHPYDPRLIEVILIVGLWRRIFRYKHGKSERMVQLSRNGIEYYTDIHNLLHQSGYFAERVKLSYVYQFDTVEDWDDMSSVVWPDADEVRVHYVDWMNIQSGQSVLEVACGTGALTFDAGLYDTVGASGRLLASDISQGMLDRAIAKHRLIGMPHQVQFDRVSVEHLPYPDATFDIVMGSAFLHFTDAPRALQEMTRVAKPGGTISVLQGLQFHLDRPFFRDWFEPIFELARRRNVEGPSSYLPTEDQLMQYFSGIGLRDLGRRHIAAKWVFDDPEIVVQHLVRGVSFFQTELMELPWDDRRAITAELIDRGRDVCRRYPFAERVILIPSLMIKGVRPR